LRPGEIVKDPRFVDEAEWILGNQRGRARGEALMRELGDASVLTLGVRAILSGDVDRSAAEKLPVTLAQEVARFVDGLDVHSDGAWVAIAKGLAAIAVDGTPSVQRLMESASRLERAPQWVHHAFHEEVFALLEELDNRIREHWLSLSSAPPTVQTAQRRIPRTPIDVTRQEATWQVADPFELWDEGGAAIPLIAAYEPLNLLRRSDEQRWFRAVDAWGDGRLVFAALFGSHVRHDREALLRYLAQAAPVFDEAGNWTGRTAALVLAYTVVEHASALANAVRLSRAVAESERDSAVARLIDDELPSYFKEAWRTLLARTDGLALAAALHVRLAEPTGGVFHINVPAIALRTLSDCLIETRPSAAVLRTLWWRRRDGHRGVGRSRYVSGLRAFGCAAAIANSDQAFDAELFDWLAELLRGDASEWAYLAANGSIPALLERIAELFAKDDRALSKLETLYASFEPSRRRGEFGRTHAESDADFASIVLNVLLVRVLDLRYKAGSVGGVVDASARIFRRALRLFLVSSPSFDATLSARAALTFAIELRVCVNRTALRECVDSIMTDPCHAAEVAAVLLTSTPRAELEAAFGAAYGSLLDLHESAREWAVATALPRDLKAAGALSTALRVGRTG
jgi:hypothetical protein